jgi:hypothetical protein
MRRIPYFRQGMKAAGSPLGLSDAINLAVVQYKLLPIL